MNSPINKLHTTSILKTCKDQSIDDGLIYLQITRGVAERDFKFQKMKTLIVMIAKGISRNYDNIFKRG